MAKKRVYVETSVLSYLTARPSRDAFTLACQQRTAMWWERRLLWDCFLTPIVLQEAERGDPVAAAKRLEKAKFLAEFPDPPEAEFLANLLVTRKLVPTGSKIDAAHLATAAIYGSHYLLTWNQKHLDNLELCFRIEECIREQGWTPAKVVTPERLLSEELP